MLDLNAGKRVREAPFEEVLRVLAAENKKRRDNRTGINWCLGIAIGVLLVAQAILLIRGRGFMDYSTFFSLIVLFGCGVAFSNTHKAALERMEELATRESVGFLIEAYATTSERDITEVCERALLKALPLVESEDDFDGYQLGLLYGSLRKTNSLPLAEGILDATQRIGGSEAIPYLEEFRASASKRKEQGWDRLATKSIGVLPDLRVRVARAIIERRLEESEAYSSAVRQLDES